MRESPPHRISTTPLLNSGEKEKWEGEISQQYDEGFILVITSSTLISTENLEYTVAFESHFRRNRLIQSSSMVQLDDIRSVYFSFQIQLKLSQMAQRFYLSSEEQNITRQKEANKSFQRKSTLCVTTNTYVATHMLNDICANTRRTSQVVHIHTHKNTNGRKFQKVKNDENRFFAITSSKLFKN